MSVNPTTKKTTSVPTPRVAKIAPHSSGKKEGAVAMFRSSLETGRTAITEFRRVTGACPATTSGLQQELSSAASPSAKPEKKHVNN